MARLVVVTRERFTVVRQISSVGGGYSAMSRTTVAISLVSALSPSHG